MEQCYVKSRGSADGQILATCDCNLDLVSFILLDGASGLSCVLPSRSSDQLEGMTLPGEADGQPAISYITEIANTCVLPADLCERVECPEASSDCKVAGECDAMTGQCTDETDAPNGIDCDDGDTMTNSDVCTAGVCRGTGE